MFIYALEVIDDEGLYLATLTCRTKEEADILESKLVMSQWVSAVHRINLDLSKLGGNVIPMDGASARMLAEWLRSPGVDLGVLRRREGP